MKPFKSSRRWGTLNCKKPWQTYKQPHTCSMDTQLTSTFYFDFTSVGRGTLSAFCPFWLFLTHAMKGLTILQDLSWAAPKLAVSRSHVIRSLGCWEGGDGRPRVLWQVTHLLEHLEVGLSRALFLPCTLFSGACYILRKKISMSQPKFSMYPWYRVGQKHTSQLMSCNHSGMLTSQSWIKASS